MRSRQADLRLRSFAAAPAQLQRRRGGALPQQRRSDAAQLGGAERPARGCSGGAGGVWFALPRLRQGACNSWPRSSCRHGSASRSVAPGEWRTQRVTLWAAPSVFRVRPRTSSSPSAALAPVAARGAGSAAAAQRAARRRGRAWGKVCYGSAGDCGFILLQRFRWHPCPSCDPV